MSTFAEDRAVPISTSELGLDRTRINANEQIQLIDENKPTDHSHGAKHPVTEGRGFIEYKEKPAEQSTRKRLSSKIKGALHLSSDSHAPESTAPILADAPDTNSDSRLVYPLPEKEKPTIHDLVHNPVETVKSAVAGSGGHQAAKNLAAKEVSHGREVELVKADEEVKKARGERERVVAKGTRDELMRERQDMFVRWTMDRHVSKVRVLPKRSLDEKPKPLSFFKKINGDGTVGTDWEGWVKHISEFYAQKYGSEYIGYTSDPPGPTKEVLIPSIERLLVSSAPFQELVMKTRQVYRWEDEYKTLRYLIAYYALWFFDLILPGFLGGIILLILYRKVHAPTIDDLRKDIIRTEDKKQTANSIGEFIEKEGDERWVDPLIEKVGPWLLVQLSDLANMMEVLRNFYEWRVPNRTGITVGMMVVALLAVTFTPTWLLVRSTTFSLGVVFFGLFPIGSRFPDYRLLASPVKWIFWRIPTHAEWAIKALQAEGARHREMKNSPTVQQQPVQQTPDPLGYRGPPTDMNGIPIAPLMEETRPLSDQDIGEYGSYPCRRGRLILNSIGLWFESSIGHKEEWSLRYEDIERLEKITRQVQKSIGSDSGDDLRIVARGGREFEVKNVGKRDECFSQIVGFAPVDWQVVW